MVNETDRPGITVPEIAEKYRRSRGVVANTWVLTPEWRERVCVVGHTGYRGLTPVYDAGDVHDLVREWVWLPPEESGIPADRRLTMKEIADYTGIDYSVIRSDASRGALKGHDETDAAGTRTWTRQQVDDLYYGRKIRLRKKP
ncbi:hypothetical protein BJF83_17395 [Nocardiopsis sp. CNR-923]|uniref:hypothetical protein n=1 Tax=Nocardiopsis sp. CNR-923 TaxID=1904965 RepID=UPI00096335C0|nr:hypothetical protein [Nocardiopsis sp. CNR-923]OLT27758.1 hypothetical protein BJF83_17395 [Nocardiopsis sp. CNR-923]